MKKGDQIIITALTGRTRRMINVGDVGELSEKCCDGWYAWINGFECFLNPNTTTFKLLNTTTMNNLGKVFYRNTVDEKIEITRFENILTETELENKFGKEITRIYMHGDGESFKKDAWNDYIHCRQGADIAIGLISKESFQDRIEYLKRAGKRLGEIKKQVVDEKFTKEHVIEI